MLLMLNMQVMNQLTTLCFYDMICSFHMACIKYFILCAYLVKLPLFWWYLQFACVLAISVLCKMVCHVGRIILCNVEKYVYICKFQVFLSWLLVIIPNEFFSQAYLTGLYRGKAQKPNCYSGVFSFNPTGIMAQKGYVSDTWQLSGSLP